MLHASSGPDGALARQSSVALAKQRSAAERSKRQEAERRSKDSQRESDELEVQLSRVRSAIADVQAGGDSGSERSSEDLDSLIHDVYDKFVSPRPAPAHYQGGSKEASDRARRAHQEEREREQRARERAESELRHLQKELERQQGLLIRELSNDPENDDLSEKVKEVTHEWDVMDTKTETTAIKLKPGSALGGDAELDAEAAREAAAPSLS